MYRFYPDNSSHVSIHAFRNYHMELGFGEGYYGDKEDYDISEKDTTADTSVYSMA